MLPVLLVVAALTGVDPDGSTRAEYEAEAARAGRDAAAHVRLALWCEEQGLAPERLKHLALAALADPKAALARGLMGLVKDGDAWRKPEEVAARARANAEEAAALAEYNRRRAKVPGRDADAQWKLALWCDQNGLEAEAYAHYAAVVRLDPRREAAWKRLGCKKHNGRWMTPEAIARAEAEAAAQRQADATWNPRLAGLKAALKDKDPARRAEALRRLAAIDDPRAAPAVWRAFATADPADQQLAVQVLGQLDSPDSTHGLAILALNAATPDIRRTAIETLKLRDPHHYLAGLIALLRDPLKYEVRPVGGPGSPGALFVEGERFNVGRLYLAPAPDFILVGGPSWSTDAYGFETLRIPGADRVVNHQAVKVASFTGAEFNKGVAANDPRAATLSSIQNNPQNSPQNMATSLFKSRYGTPEFARRNVRDTDYNVDVYRQTTDTFRTETTIPIGRIAAEYQASAASAQGELARDVAQVEAANAAIRDSNDRISAVLNGVTNADLPPKREAWRAWWTELLGYVYEPEPEAPKPTVVQAVPPPYLPQPVASANRDVALAGSRTTETARAHITGSGQVHFARLGFSLDCFGAGTVVQTRTGPRPIESIATGDRVLTQDTATGALAYRPVLRSFRFKPTPTVRLRVGDEAVVTTPLHRFWRPGRGWTTARDLKPGDTLRTVGGSATVSAVEPEEKARTVYNLEVAGSPAYFVGGARLLAHDHTPAGPRVDPFDAPPAVARAETTTGE